jgi:hypothetical protein
MSRGNTITGTASAVIQSAEIGLSRVHPVSSGSVLVKYNLSIAYIFTPHPTNSWYRLRFQVSEMKCKTDDFWFC